MNLSQSDTDGENCTPTLVAGVAVKPGSQRSARELAYPDQSHGDAQLHLLGAFDKEAGIVSCRALTHR